MQSTLFRCILKLLTIVLAVLPVYLLIRRPWREKSARAWAEMVFEVGLLTLIWKKKQKILSIALHSLVLPIFIEICQLFIGRSVDVDDVILNFAGGCLGAVLYFGMRRVDQGLARLAR